MRGRLQSDGFKRYGVNEQTVSETDTEFACESIRHLGYAVVDGGYEPGWLEHPETKNFP
jgi:hypothetical protein